MLAGNSGCRLSIHFPEEGPVRQKHLLFESKLEFTVLLPELEEVAGRSRRILGPAQVLGNDQGLVVITRERAKGLRSLHRPPRPPDERRPAPRRRRRRPSSAGRSVNGPARRFGVRASSRARYLARGA